jgi:hypothetical protein
VTQTTQNGSPLCSDEPFRGVALTWRERIDVPDTTARDCESDDIERERSYRVHSEVVRELGPRNAIALHTIARLSDDDGWARCTIDELSFASGLSYAAMTNALKQLRDARRIETQIAPHGLRTRALWYRLRATA